MTHKAAAKFIVAKDTFTRRLGEAERGGPGMEYVGMIVVAALLVGIIYGAIEGGDIGGQIGTLISEIFSGGSGT